MCVHFPFKSVFSFLKCKPNTGPSVFPWWVLRLCGAPPTQVFVLFPWGMGRGMGELLLCVGVGRTAAAIYATPLKFRLNSWGTKNLVLLLGSFIYWLNYTKVKCCNFVVVLDRNVMSVLHLREVCLWFFHLLFIYFFGGVFLHKTTDPIVKTQQGLDEVLLGSVDLSAWPEVLSNENKAELGVIAHCPQALVSELPLIIWRTQNISLSYVAS